MGNKADKKAPVVELTEKQIGMLKANTTYTETEIRDWHEGFIRDCPSGKLDKKTFLEIYKKFYPEGKADNYCKYAFRIFDKNRDGTIHFEEFLLAIAATSQGDLDDRLGVAFDMYDFANRGQIDQKQLVALITAMYDLVGEKDRKGDHDPKKVAADIITKMDVIGDKKISKAEFIAGCKNDSALRQLLAPNI